MEKKASTRPDFATVLGLMFAVAGIVGGLLLEGGKIHDISQYTAAVIVLGGTLGAVMVSTPLNVLVPAAKRFGWALFDSTSPLDGLVEQIIAYATKARKNGIVSLEEEAESETDPFLRKALQLAVDGTDLQEIRSMLELEIAQQEQRFEAEAKVYEAAGGFSPTIGIIGAVIGLIQVMKNLSDIDKVGHGIAVSFVATVYGVAVANLLFLPVAAKIKARGMENTRRREVVVEGIVAIVEGLNPKLIRAKLEAYAPPAQGRAAAKPASSEAQA